MMKSIQTGFEVKEENKYTSDDEEQEVWQNGFSSTRKPKFSTESILTARDVGTQQMIFDRLPLSQSNKAIFFKWLLEEEKERKNNLENVITPDQSASRSSQGDDERVKTTVPVS